MRASIAVAMAALSAILIALCLRGLLPGLGVLAPVTLAFVGACVSVIGVNDDDATLRGRRLAIAAALVNSVLLIVGCGMLLHALAR